MMQAKRRDPGLPNYSGMGASPREKAKFLDRVKLTILEEEHSIWPGYDLRAVLLSFQVASQGHGQHREERWNCCRVDCLTDTHAARTTTSIDQGWRAPPRVHHVHILPKMARKRKGCHGPD